MGTVLFVDDEPRVLQSVKRLLRRQFTVETAEGGEEGLALIKKKGPFAVIFPFPQGVARGGEGAVSIAGSAPSTGLIEPRLDSAGPLTKSCQALT